MEFNMRTQFINVIEELEIEMGDIQFRRNIKGMNKYYLPFVLLELNEFMKIKKGLFIQCFSFLNEPLYAGNIYEYIYVSKYNKNIKGSDKYEYPSFHLIKNDKVVKEWFETIFKVSFEEYNWNNYTHCCISGHLDWEKFRCLEYPTPNYYIKTYKVRKIIIRFNYKSTPIDYFSVLNFKHWDSETKKTSNKGLGRKDIRNVIIKNVDCNKWSGYISIDDIKKLAENNGFNPIKKHKYYYGHYAEFLLKI